MNTVLLLWRTGMRVSWRAAVSLAALIALRGGITLAVAVAGAVPTSYVYLFALMAGGDSAHVVAAFPESLPGSAGSPSEWSTSALPPEVRQAIGARAVIWLGVGALAVVVATVGQTLLGSVRQRRRGYAVRKVLSFTWGQIWATVFRLSGAVLAVALAGAVPLGIAAGRWMRIAFAGNLGIEVRPVVPPLLLLGVIGLMLVAVEGGALVPATLALRPAPGGVLRVE